MLRHKYLGFAGAALMAALASRDVYAQASGDKAAAEALFQAGRDLMSKGQFAEACGKLEASQRLDAGLGTLLYLADCYEKANRLASAWATFHEAESIAMGRSDSSRADIARQRYTAIEPKLSKLWIKVTDGNPTNIEVMRDGAPVPRESWDVALPTDAGDHMIEAKAPGHAPWSTKVTVAGEAANVPVQVPVLQEVKEEPKPAPTVATTMPAAPADSGQSGSGGTQKVIGLVMGGVGVVGLGLSTVFTLKAKSKNDQSKENGHCPNDPNVCDQTGTDLRNDARNAAKTATAFGIAGGVLLAGGVVVFLTAPSRKKTDTGASLLLQGGVASGLVSVKGAF